MEACSVGILGTSTYSVHTYLPVVLLFAPPTSSSFYKARAGATPQLTLTDLSCLAKYLTEVTTPDRKFRTTNHAAQHTTSRVGARKPYTHLSLIPP